MATGHDAASSHDDHDDHGHDAHAHDDHGHDAHAPAHDAAGGWVLIPLAVGLVVGLVLAVVFGIGADAIPII